MNYISDIDIEHIDQSFSSYREKRKQMNNLQSLPLKEKIDYSQHVIDKILDRHRKPAVAWSGGKDSTVLLYLVLKKDPNIEVVWVNTGVEYPECVRFIRQVTRDWRIKLNVSKSKMTFWQTVDKYGYPYFGKGNGSGYWYKRVDLWKRKGRSGLAKIIEVSRASSECCRILKENPAKKLYRELEVDCVMLGNMVDESHQRFLTWIKKGGYFYSSSESRWKAWPLSIWNDDDIWQFHKIHNIPHSAIYDKGHRRNGCWPCMMDLKYKDNHLQALHKSHPKLWDFLIARKGVGEVILALKLGLSREEMDKEPGKLKQYVTSIMRKNPCYFDKI